MTPGFLTASGFLFTAFFICCRAQTRDLCAPSNNKYEIFKTVYESARKEDKVVSVPINGNESEVVLTSEYNEYFAFDPETRFVIVNGTIDAEVDQQSQVVKISCREKVSGRTVEITVNIQIQDTNDNGPKFDYSVYNITIGEMTEVQSPIPTNIQAVDNDVTPIFSIVYYSILEGPYKDYFVILNPLKPELTLLKQLDYEMLPEMSITIMAQDKPLQDQSGRVMFNATCEVVITIIDEDDQNPVFNSSLYRGVISNESSLNSVITITPPIYAYDPDVTLNTKVLYSFHGAEFQVMHTEAFPLITDVGPQFPSDARDQSEAILGIDPDTAVTTLIKKPSADEVYLLVQATQVDNPSRYGVALLAVQVQGSNVNAPQFARDSFKVVVTEIFPVGEVVTMVIASDADLGSIIKYSLNGSSASFTINESTGDITLIKELDYTTQPQHVLKVIASDGMLQSTTTVTISVKPVNNKPPTILTTGTDLNVTAERSKGDVILDIAAVDRDEGSTLSFRLLNYNNLFSINDEGVLRISADPEDLIYDSYSVAFVVSDGGQPRYETAAAVQISFPKAPVAKPVTAEEDSAIPIVLGVIAAFLFIIVIILLVYICRRRLRDKEHLDRAKKRRPSRDPTALTFKPKPGTLGRNPKVNIDFRDEASDGETTVQENPLNTDNNGHYYNFGHIGSDTETETCASDIQVETSVIPYDHENVNNNSGADNNDNIYNTSQCSVESEEYPNYKNQRPSFYRNGSLSTYRDSSGSEMSLNISPSESADSKKGLMPGSLAHTRVPEENGGFWDRNGNSIPTITNMANLDPDQDVVPPSQKQELTVYF